MHACARARAHVCVCVSAREIIEEVSEFFDCVKVCLSLRKKQMKWNSLLRLCGSTRFSWTLSSMCFGTMRRRTSIYSHTFSSDCWFRLLMATSLSLGGYRSLWWGTLASSQTGFLATMICVFNCRYITCIKLNMHLPVIDISVTSRVSYTSCYASEIKNWKLRQSKPSTFRSFKPQSRNCNLDLRCELNYSRDNFRNLCILKRAKKSLNQHYDILFCRVTIVIVPFVELYGSN